MPAARVTLVTGFPNFRAIHLVSHILASRPDDIWAVVSPENFANAERHREQLPADQRARLRFFSGQVSAIDMGLSGLEYQQLSAAVGCIQHLAQTSATAEGKDRCESVNIGGMREVLELARACARLESLVVHSSVAVSGDRVGRFVESELEVGQRFRGAGPATLARAELMARRKMDHLPIVVLRTSQIVSSSASASLDVLEGVYLLILMMLSSPQELSLLLPQMGDAPLNVAPVDHLARAAEAWSRSSDALGQTLHLTDPSPMSLRMAFNLCMKQRTRLVEAGFVAPSVGALMRRDRLLPDGAQSSLWRPRTFIKETFREVRYGAERAERLLRDASLICPPLESYFQHLVKHVAQTIASVASVPD